MMAVRRTTRVDIDIAFHRVQRVFDNAYALDHSNGGWRLELADGSRSISPRLPAREFALWLDGFYEGRMAR